MKITEDNDKILTGQMISNESRITKCA